MTSLEENYEGCIEEMEERIFELEAENAEYKSQIEELENRIEKIIRILS